MHGHRPAMSVASSTSAGGGFSPSPEGEPSILSSRGGVSSAAGVASSVESMGRSNAVFMPPIAGQRVPDGVAPPATPAVPRVGAVEWRDNALQEAFRTSSFSAVTSADLAAEQAVAATPSGLAPPRVPRITAVVPARRPGSLHVTAGAAPLPPHPQHATAPASASEAVATAAQPIATAAADGSAAVEAHQAAAALRRRGLGLEPEPRSSGRPNPVPAPFSGLFSQGSGLLSLDGRFDTAQSAVSQDVPISSDSASHAEHPSSAGSALLHPDSYPPPP